MSIHKIETSVLYKIVFYTCLVTSVGLITAGFILPPRGVIDPSVLTAVGELLVFPVIASLRNILQSEKSVEIHTKNGTEIKVGDEK